MSEEKYTTIAKVVAPNVGVEEIQVNAGLTNRELDILAVLCQYFGKPIHTDDICSILGNLDRQVVADLVWRVRKKLHPNWLIYSEKAYNRLLYIKHPFNDAEKCFLVVDFTKALERRIIDRKSKKEGIEAQVAKNLGINKRGGRVHVDIEE